MTGRIKKLKGLSSNVASVNCSEVDDDGDLDVCISQFRKARKRKIESLNDQELDSKEADFSGEKTSLEVEGFRIGDIVWAKALPHTWWPGLIRRRSGIRVLVSFMGSERSRFFHVSEIYSFEDNFGKMSKRIGGRSSDVLDLALDLFGRRVALGLICTCRSSSEYAEVGHLTDEGLFSTEQAVEVKKSFQPVEILDFVLSMAASLSVEDAETVSVTRAAARVGAFRRYAFIKLDWIYQETMNLSESYTASDEPTFMIKKDEYFPTQQVENIDLISPLQILIQLLFTLQGRNIKWKFLRIKT